MRNRMHVSQRRRLGRATVLVVWAGAFLVLLGGAAFAGFRYEQARASRILPGIEIAGVDVGGLTKPQAERALSTVMSGILDRIIEIRAGSHSYTITPRKMGTRVDLSGAVDRALSISEEYGWPSRVYHRLLNKPVEGHLDLPVTNDVEALAKFVNGIEADVESPVRNATRDFVGDRLVVQHSRAGRQLSRKGATARVLAAVRGPTSSVKLSVQTVQPDITDSDLGMLLVVRISQNKLYLYDGMDLVKSYPVATGQLGQYDTPQGHFEVINKRINPTWVNPAKDSWGANEPDFIPPGPDNPLGTRALDLDAPGIRIHGTPSDSSIGTYASHGCVRMHIPDSEDLYGRVEVGTPVIITW